MIRISYWIVPIFSAIVWLAMLLALLLTWVTDGSPQYPSMNEGQTIAYISDIGAQELKPLFIAMGAVSVVTFDLAFILERYLRHSGRLVQNTSTFQKILSILSMIAALAGAAGLILLSVFDTLRHPRMHNAFLALFLAGYIISAIFTCWEYQRLGIHFREHAVLRISFWIKLFFILIEVALAIAFGVSQNQSKYNIAGILEWVIALIYTFYVISFALDFIPALDSKLPFANDSEIAMAEAEADAAARRHTAFVNPIGRFYGHGNANRGAQSHGYRR